MQPRWHESGSGQRAPLHRKYEKPLPAGAWVSFNKLPPETTDVDLQNFLQGCGIAVPLENISVRSHYDGCAALVSFNKPLLCAILNWLIDGRTLGSRDVTADSW